MAVLPTIPTSFVPHAPGGGEQKFRTDFTGAFALLAYGALGIVFLMAIGVFVYERVLEGKRAAQNTALAQEEANIDTETVESFVKLRDRLNQSRILLDKHTALSYYFDELARVLPENVRFTTMEVAADPAGVVKVQASGVAKSFNALASFSSTLGEEKSKIRDAIFSKIKVSNKDSSVSFGFSASLDSELIKFKAPASAESINEAESGTPTPSAPTQSSGPAPTPKPSPVPPLTPTP